MKNKTKKTCGYCGKPFTPKTGWVKYCSVDCGHSVYHENQRIRDKKLSKGIFDKPKRKTIKLKTGLEILNCVMGQEIYESTKYWTRK